MTNKIMELAIAYASDYANGGGDKSALQAEVTRLETELAHWKESRQSAIDAGELMKAERNELRAKLATLEAQEPVARVLMEAYPFTGVHVIGCKASISIRTPLYLAAGAKDKP